MTKLKNKIVFITGATSGFGKETAISFAQKGARLIIAARRKEKLKELNISEHSLDQLATDAMLQTRLLQNNPRELEWQQAREIYQAIYS